MSDLQEELPTCQNQIDCLKVLMRDSIKRIEALEDVINNRLLWRYKK